MAATASTQLDAVAGRVTAVCVALSHPRRQVRYRRAVYLPGDELCLHEFEASSPELVAQAAAAAGLQHVRVVEVVCAVAGGTP